MDPKQDLFQPPQHQVTTPYTPPPGNQGQYTGVVYGNGQPQQPDYYAYQTPTPGALTHQNTMASTHGGINPVSTAPIPIQPDPLPKALTQVQVDTVTAQQVAQKYPGATMAYEPRLTAPDEFHYSIWGCFGDFFKCRNMNTCKFM